MSDPHPHDRDPEDDVRRLLAEARHHEPVPVDVAARLHRVLERLATEEPAVEADEPDRVADLAARRRRRTRTLLVAAAAVVVVGVGLGRLDVGISSISGDTGGDESAASSAPAADEDLSFAAPESAPGDGTANELDLMRRTAPLHDAPEPVVVEDADFASTTRLRALRREARMRPLARALDKAAGLSAAGGAQVACRPGPYGEGRLLTVRYDGRPAVLALRPATGDSAVVELLRCGSGTVRRSAALPRS